MTVKTIPYVWDKHSSTPIPGALLRRSDHKKAFLFLPMDELIEISNRLVDIAEQHDKQKD